MEFPLRGIDLCLRPFQRTDAAALHAAALESVASIGAWMPWCHEKYSLAEAQAWIDTCIGDFASGNAYEMGIFSLDGQQFLGGIGINLISHLHNLANLSYWVRSTRQRRGIALDALRLMTDFGLHELLLTRLEIVIANTNFASRHLAEKVGAHFEGIARNRLMLHGKLHPAAIYALISQSADSQ
jgi:RimJ/RimL family protein N-acetyltransferase